MIRFQKSIQEQFDKMCATGKLFRSSLTGQQVWDLYINAFLPEHNPVFRDPSSTTHNCNLCNNFIRRYGNIVAIDENYNIITMFDVEASEEYATVAQTLSKALRAASVSDVFFETYNELDRKVNYESVSKSLTKFKLGLDKNVKRYTREEAEAYKLSSGEYIVKPNETRTFNHLYVSVPKQFVDMSGSSVESIMGNYRDDKNVFQRAMQEIPLDTLNLVKDLIIQGSLLNGETHLFKIETIIPLKKKYDKLSAEQRDNWCWINSYKFQLSKFRNELIGTLCVELAEGKELNDACKSWNVKVDPKNYMKATAPITKKQIEEARKFVEENGYTESFDRRFANLDDIKVTEILHVNNGDGKIKTVSIFDNVKSTSTRHKRSEFDGIEEVSIEKFMNDILPGCDSVEVLLTNKHEGNLVSLTTANVEDSKPIFKWNNNYSWTFNGNLAGKSEIKEAVKTAGGKVDGVLRFSIMWSGDDIDNSDLDAHCKEPNGNEIYYSNKRSYTTEGNLDIDITQPLSQMPKGAVENITFPTLSKMSKGKYKFFVNQFSARHTKGFKAEIEFNGELYSYEYNRPVSGNVQVAEVTFENGEFVIKHILPATDGVGVSKEIYGLETNKFHTVNLACLSPNHWGENNVGNKHYFFMLNDCKCPVSIRSFHNENLNADLLQHRKVMEVLGATNVVNPSDKQLSGLGFNATVRDEVIVRLKGTFKRVIKIKLCTNKQVN